MKTRSRTILQRRLPYLQSLGPSRDCCARIRSAPREAPKDRRPADERCRYDVDLLLVGHDDAGGWRSLAFVELPPAPRPGRRRRKESRPPPPSSAVGKRALAHPIGVPRRWARVRLVCPHRSRRGTVSAISAVTAPFDVDVVPTAAGQGWRSRPLVALPDLGLVPDQLPGRGTGAIAAASATASGPC